MSSLRFMNIEGQAEAGDLTNRFEQVTLFRTHQVAEEAVSRHVALSLLPTHQGATTAVSVMPERHHVPRHSTMRCQSRTDTASTSGLAGTAASSTCMRM